jgi:hypothetical protein
MNSPRRHREPLRGREAERVVGRHAEPVLLVVGRLLIVERAEVVGDAGEPGHPRGVQVVGGRVREARPAEQQVVQERAVPGGGRPRRDEPPDRLPGSHADRRPGGRLDAGPALGEQVAGYQHPVAEREDGGGVVALVGRVEHVLLGGPSGDRRRRGLGLARVQHDRGRLPHRELGDARQVEGEGVAGRVEPEDDRGRRVIARRHPDGRLAVLVELHEVGEPVAVVDVEQPDQVAEGVRPAIATERADAQVEALRLLEEADRDVQRRLAAVARRDDVGLHGEVVQDLAVEQTGAERDALARPIRGRAGSHDGGGNVRAVAEEVADLGRVGEVGLVHDLAAGEVRMGRVDAGVQHRHPGR